MNIIYGLYQKDRGEIIIGGKTRDIRSPQDSLKLNIGMVPQFFKLVSDMSIFENIFLFIRGTRFFVERKKIREEIVQLSRLFGFGLEEKLHVEIANLSEGEKQKVEILKILARGSKILLFDEATNVLAPNELESFLQVIKDLNQKDYTILYITHRLQEALAISHRISVFRKGRLVGTVLGKDATYDGLTRMMVGADLVRKQITHQAIRGKRVLHLENLKVKDDRNLPALRGVSFELHEGEIVGLASIEGNGADILAETIMGLRKLQGGSIHYQATDITHLSPANRMKAGIGFIPSSNTLIPSFTVRDNTILDYPDREPFSTKGFLHAKAITTHAVKIVSTYQIQTPNIYLQAGKLSGGNRQRLALGRKLEVQPRLMIAYMPTKGLDIKSQNFIHEKLQELKRTGSTILFIGTDLDELLQNCERLLVMYRGEVVRSFSDLSQVSKIEIGLSMTGGAQYIKKETIGASA
jgi:simple sugar transport system ATP-binding protein